MPWFKACSNDKDGSFAEQVLAENREVVDAFNAKVQERMEQERQQTAAREISVQQNPAEREIWWTVFRLIAPHEAV